MTLNDRLRRMMDIQGFLDVEDTEIAHWVKFSNFVCFVGFTAGVYLQSPMILYLMSLVAVLGLTFHNTPFDHFYNLAIAPVLSKPQLPERPAPARFACFVGLVWSAFTASAFLVGWTGAGIVLGVLLVIASGLQGIGNYCVASVLWRKIYGWPDRE